MTHKQSAQLSRAEQIHLDVIYRDSKYKETGHWTPVLVSDMKGKGDDIVGWLESRNLKRGTDKARNDYLIPITGFFLFKDVKVAVEFKLTWS